MNIKELCERYDATSIQQLYKILKDKSTGKDYNKDIFPTALLQSVFDGITGTRLDHILALYNHIYVPYAGTSEATRLKIGKDMRRKGLIITFRDLDNYSWTQRYKGEDSVSDEAWQKDENWEAWDFDSLLKDVTEVIKDILNHVVDYPDLYEYIKQAVQEAVNQYLDEGNLDTLIENILLKILPDYMEAAINNYFSGDEGKELLKEIINGCLDDVIGDYISELQTALLNNERVTANALARHEMAITEIQNQLGEG